MRIIVTCGFLLLLACPAGAQPKPPEREPFDEAIDRGLRYLAQQQQRDGSWRSGAASRDPAISALAVMAFLSAGHVPGEGPYGDVVEAGVRFVRSIQQRGLFPYPGGAYTMYCHGICTLMLAEVAGMTQVDDPDTIRQELELAIQIILRAQRTTRGSIHRGGWRYHVSGEDADISVTGWQLMALRSARNLGCDVPAERIEMALEFIERCRDSSTGGYRYMPTGFLSNDSTPARTGTAVLSLELAGKEYHRSPESLKAGAFILKNPLRPDRTFFFYGVYYGSQGMFQLGGNYWESYRPRLHELLLRRHPQRPNGAWYGHNSSTDDRRWGPNYCTAMGILALTVEYRLLPIYQRGGGEDSAEP